MLGLGTFGELPFGDPNNAQIHNIEFAETGFGMTFSTGSETVTGTAVVSPDGSAITVSLGEETAFGEAFQVLISLSAGSPNLLIWNEVDDTEADSVTWSEVFED